MTSQDLKRKLVAILSADVEGYSRLMGEDEVGTIRTLTTYRDKMAGFILLHRGRVVDAPGDNLLAEFASVVDAVQCALKIQEELKLRNADLPPNQKMEFRIGVNLGDVIDDGERIYGDGVNIASRLEGLAQAGGICISGSAYDQIQSKLAFGGECIGEQLVKNIATPIKVYKIWPDPAADGRIVSVKKAGGARRFWLAVAAFLIILAGAAAFFAWQGFQKQGPATDATDASQPTQHAGTSTIDKPSIAVLPFSNLSDDKEKEYLCDGITRDLITDLSKFSELSVAAGYMSFKYKGKEGDLERISRELRVRYVLEGSMQNSGDRIRINVQLIEVPSGKTLWGDRYDRKIKEVFDVQDEIIQTIVRVLSLKITEAELARIQQKDTSSYVAYDYVQQGWHQVSQRKRAGNQKADQLFSKALAIDPTYADAYLGMAEVQMQKTNYGWTEFPGKTIRRALEFARKAASIDPDHAQARSQLGYIYMRNGEYDMAIKELESAIKLNPNNWRSYRDMGAVLLYSGRPAEALVWYEGSMKYDPYISGGQLMNLGIMNLLTDQHETAVRWLKEGTYRRPNFLGTHIILAATYAEMGRLDEARREVDEILRISPFFKTEFYGSAYRNPEHRTRIVRGLQKAGLQ